MSEPETCFLERPANQFDLTICCGSATASLEQEFREHGFTAIQHIADATFAGFLMH
jgi:hypothetical protein